MEAPEANIFRQFGATFRQTITRTLESDSKLQIVSDRLFTDQLRASEEIKAFLIKENIVNEKSPSEYSDLSLMSSYRYSRLGSVVSAENWERLNRISMVLVAQLKNSDAEKQYEFLLWRCRRYFRLPALSCSVALLIALLGFCAVSIAPPGFRDDFIGRLLTLVFVVAWTIALGGLGVAAFFATSVLSQNGRSVQSGRPSELLSSRAERLNDKTYLQNRLVSGLIFAFILGVCFSYDSISLVYKYAMNQRAATTADVSQYVKDTITIMTPFLFGYSTDIALGVLSRGIASLRTFFGMDQTR
jgi:hypothetical protein